MTTMVPVPYRVVSRRTDTEDVVTLDLAPVGVPLEDWQPGQFTMVYAFGVGEVPISVSGGDTGHIRHTIRTVGAVTRAICDAAVGTTIGLRGPFGHGWHLPDGGDLLIVAGGIGLAPLRPLILAALADRDRFDSVAVLIGARTPADLLFTDEYDKWRQAGAVVYTIVDRGAPGWTGPVGVVTALLDRIAAGGARSTAYLCGPEIMMRFVARDLISHGFAADRIQVSMERNMRCGIGWCGHCQLGSMIICRDGPVTGFDFAGPLMEVREL